MDDTNLAPWIRVINEGNLVVFQGKLFSVCHVEEIPLNEGNSVEIPPQGARREVNLTAVSKMTG